MKIGIVAALVSLAFPLALRSQTQPVTFKGNTLGMSLRKFKQVNRGPLAWADPGDQLNKRLPRVVDGPLCTDTVENFPGSNTPGIVPGEIICNVSPGDLNVDARTVGGRKVDQIIYRFYADKLYEIDLTFTSGGYSQVKAAFISEFGQPSVVGSTAYQSGNGARWKSENLTWKIGNSATAVLMEGSGNGPVQDAGAAARGSIREDSLGPPS